MMCLCLITLAIIAPSILSVKINKGCSDYNTGETLDKDFNLDKIKGKWYEIKRYENNFEHGFDCGRTTFTTNLDVSVALFKYMNLSKDKAVLNATMIINPVHDKEKLFGLIITFTAFLVGVAVGFISSAANSTKSSLPSQLGIHFLDTDYKHYLVVWMCEDIISEGVKGENGDTGKGNDENKGVDGNKEDDKDDDVDKGKDEANDENKDGTEDKEKRQANDDDKTDEKDEGKDPGKEEGNKDEGKDPGNKDEGKDVEDKKPTNAWSEQALWIYSSIPKINSKYNQLAEDAINRVGLDLELLKSVNHHHLECLKLDKIRRKGKGGGNPLKMISSFSVLLCLLCVILL